ncbi:ABC transporter permease, partial [Roseisolibacter sp. H3M3-2]|uniref:ABC transporter permease n=1 Tax=Roseisolibacter sp. H3M3-2 TaxID=3031323 RepID=UPI0023DB6918
RGATTRVCAPRVRAPLPPVPGAAIVRALSPLVPSARRAEWRAEWEGELAWGAHEGARRGEPAALVAARLRWRALGDLLDAAWLRRHHSHSGGPVLAHDLRYAARALRRRPGFVAVVVLTLALGIGATTALFSVVNGVLLRPLAFPEAERLVEVRGVSTDGNPERVGASASYPDYVDYRDQSTRFAHLAAFRTWTTTLTAADAEPARLPLMLATASYFPTLGVRPLVGRALVPADERPGAPAVAVLGHALWRQRFGGDPAVVGRAITLDGVPTTVVGVLPPDAKLDRADVQLWQPVVPGALERERGVHRYSVVGRLRPGATPEQATTELRAVARRLEAAFPRDNAKRTVELRALRESVVGDARPALLILFGAVTLVLLVGCANLASLFLARGAAREREMAVRAALGAGRTRLMRQWMTESLLLTLSGGLAGLAVAWLGTRALLAFVPQSIPRAGEVTLDLPVLGFLLAVSVATGLVFGALPALQLRRDAGAPGLAGALSGGRATAGRSRTRLRQGLVVAEMTLATVLVVGAALLLKSFWQLQSTRLPVRPEGVVVTRLLLPETRYDSSAKIVRFYARLREEVAALPGVRSAAVAYEHPIGAGWTSSFTIVGRPKPTEGDRPEARVRPVQPGYFRTVGLALRAGRDVSADDRMDTPGVVVVNEAFVRRHFAGADPLGHVLDREGPWWPGQPTTFTIVGVVADEPYLGVGREADPATYYPHAQFPMGDMWLVTRTDLGVAATAPLLRERVWRLDPALPVEEVTALRALLGTSLAEPRFNASLLALFAGAALLLAAVGIYGVLAYTVAQRTREIGVRLALGAARGQVVRLVVGQGLRVAAAGVVLGTAGALALGRVLGALLQDVSQRDPAVLGAVVVVLTGTALAAAWLPARRASRIAPTTALRAE